MYYPETITRDQAEKILESHSIKPDQNTVFDTINRKMVENTSFNDEFGIKEFYNTKSIFNWLGY